MSAIPRGSTVLVTGINGYIASYIASELLAAGYRVRGTARTSEKGDVVKAALEKKHGSGAVEIVVVGEMEADGAFDEAVKGVSGVIHVATVVSFDSNPNNVIPQVLAGIRGTLDSAAKESSVKRFVFTSSSSAATSPKPNEKFTISKDTWNEEDVKAAWAPPPYDNPSRAWSVYAASKTQAEQELWKYVREQKPGFVVNAVLPNTNIGPLFYPTQWGSTTNWALDVYKGKSEFLPDAPPQWFVDVRDTAKLHVIALTNPDVQNERVFAFAETYNRRDFFTIIREAKPHAELPVEPLDDDRDLSKIAERPRAVALLQWFGKDRFTSLKDSVIDTIEAYDNSL